MKHRLLGMSLAVIGFSCLPAIGLAADIASNEADATAAAETAEARTRAAKIEALIAELGGDDFFARERAQQELAEIGFEAFDALSEAAEHNDDLEIQSRARYLVRLMRLASVVDSDPPEIKALLGDYESRSEAERIERIKQAAALSDDKGLAVLCRLVRFERSAVLSKEAAAAIILQKWPGQRDAAERRAETIRRGIGQSARPAAAWLAAYVAARTDAAAAIDQWQKLVAAEERRAIEAPHQTRPEILAALWREQALLLRKVGREDDADQILMRLVDGEESSISADTLEDLLNWLVELRAFNVVDRLAEKFADRFADEPLLLYSLADARRAQGKEDLVRAAITKALAIDGEGDPALEHLRVAVDLMRRHRWRWAEGEYRRVAEVAPRDSKYSIDARARLAEVLHDRGADDEAGSLMEEVVADMEKNHQENNDDENANRTLEATRARMHYFYACSLVKADQRNERIRRLVDAVTEDPTDADALIALYRVENLDPPLAEQNRKRIRDAAELFRQQIQQQPDDPTPYNQFAWLVANTEGDYREALRCSEKSLELVRANPRLAGSEASLLDTLGRCYYAVGDYENAVKAQSRAVELDPESGLMASQLKIFRGALEKAKQEK
ncbi:MAG TPA: tetratricopeptide repeat protein [Pirellulales bacterium]|nr:tetratricopeptide repeat protein [Pirellulales bacterium]